MTNQRKALITQITLLEKKLHSQKKRASKHKESLMKWIDSNEFAVLMALIPAFICGWKIRRSPGIRKALKQIIRLGVMTILSKKY